MFQHQTVVGSMGRLFLRGGQQQLITGRGRPVSHRAASQHAATQPSPGVASTPHPPPFTLHTAKSNLHHSLQQTL